MSRRSRWVKFRHLRYCSSVLPFVRSFVRLVVLPVLIRDSLPAMYVPRSRSPLIKRCSTAGSSRDRCRTRSCTTLSRIRRNLRTISRPTLSRRGSTRYRTVVLFPRRGCPSPCSFRFAVAVRLGLGCCGNLARRRGEGIGLDAQAGPAPILRFCGSISVPLTVCGASLYSLYGYKSTVPPLTLISWFSCVCLPSDARVVLYPDGARNRLVRQAGVQEPDRERSRARFRRQKDEQAPQELPR